MFDHSILLPSAIVEIIIIIKKKQNKKKISIVISIIKNLMIINVLYLII